MPLVAAVHAKERHQNDQNREAHCNLQNERTRIGDGNGLSEGSNIRDSQQSIEHWWSLGEGEWLFLDFALVATRAFGRDLGGFERV